MTIRFRRTINFGLFRLNIGKTGISTSIGKPGASVTVGKRGIRSNLGIPGTGVSFFSIQKPPEIPKFGNSKPQEPLQSTPPPVFPPPPPQTTPKMPSQTVGGRPQSPKRKKWILIGGGIGLLLLLGVIFGKSSTPEPKMPTATMIFQIINTSTITMTPTFTETPKQTFTPTITPTLTATPLHPFGTTGLCGDGSFTEAIHSQGACSGHGGLSKYWGP